MQILYYSEKKKQTTFRHLFFNFLFFIYTHRPWQQHFEYQKITIKTMRRKFKFSLLLEYKSNLRLNMFRLYNYYYYQKNSIILFIIVLIQLIIILIHDLMRILKYTIEIHFGWELCFLFLLCVWCVYLNEKSLFKFTIVTKKNRKKSIICFFFHSAIKSRSKSKIYFVWLF